MENGFFPLDKSDDGYKTLMDAARHIEDIADRFHWASAEKCFPEDAVIDGMAVRDLQDAAKLIRRNLKNRCAHINEIGAGTVLRIAGGFTCANEGELVVLNKDSRGCLYFRCEEGEHYLAGQLYDDGYLVGLELVK